MRRPDPFQAGSELMLRVAEQPCTGGLRSVSGDAAAGVACRHRVAQHGGVQGRHAVQQLQPADHRVGDGVTADRGEHLARAKLGARGEHRVQVGVGDATLAVPGTSTFDGLVGPAAEQRLALGDRTLEVLVLQAVQGVVMDERRHRTLARQQVPPVLERVGELRMTRRRRAWCGSRHRRMISC